MFYCDKDCQTKDWDYHQYECKIFKDYYFIVSHDAIRQLLRLYNTFRNRYYHYNDLFTEKRIPGTDPPEYRSYWTLPIQKAVKNDPVAVQRFNYHMSFFGLAGIKFYKPNVLEHYCLALSNTLEIRNHDMDPIGLSIYVLESGFEHSCTPNADLVFNGTNLQLRAIKEISPGEKITINRIDLKHSRVDRQTMLRTKYFISCSCIKCTGQEEGKFL